MVTSPEDSGSLACVLAVKNKNVVSRLAMAGTVNIEINFDERIRFVSLRRVCDRAKIAG